MSWLGFLWSMAPMLTLVLGMLLTRWLLGNPVIYAVVVFRSVFHFPAAKGNQPRVDSYFKKLAQEIAEARAAVVRSGGSLYFDEHLSDKRERVGLLESHFAFALFLARELRFSVLATPEDYLRWAQQDSH